MKGTCRECPCSHGKQWLECEECQHARHLRNEKQREQRAKKRSKPNEDKSDEDGDIGDSKPMASRDSGRDSYKAVLKTIYQAERKNGT